jgi:hypothetical protein
VASNKVFTAKPLKFWENEKNVRRFFEKFALRRNMNPLDPSTWYATSRVSIDAVKVRVFLLLLFLFFKKKTRVVLSYVWLRVDIEKQ